MILLALRNALAPIIVTADGMVTYVSPVAPWKALAPILSMEDGSVINVRPVALWKALSPMLVTVD